MEQEYYNAILLGLCGTTFALLVMVVILMNRIGRVKKRFDKIIGNSSIEHVDDLLLSLQEKLEELGAADKQKAEAIEGIREILKKMKSNVAVSRYNAFAQQGSDLSFSVAFLDDEQDGVVITGIHSREESYIYAKPVEKGNSKYALSPEEKDVIAQSAAAKRTALPSRV